MYNIKAAVSRLDFAPGTEAMEVTDIETGHFVFTPKPDRAVSLEELRKAIEGAGYKIEKASIVVTGDLVAEDRLRAEATGQSFVVVSGGEEARKLAEKTPKRVTVSGEWSREGETERIRVRDWSAQS